MEDPPKGMVNQFRLQMVVNRGSCYCPWTGSFCNGEFTRTGWCQLLLTLFFFPACSLTDLNPNAVFNFFTHCCR